MDWARGHAVTLLKVSVFNQVIFFCLFVVRVHSFGLQRQVRKKRCAESRTEECGKQLVFEELNPFHCYIFLLNKLLFICKADQVIDEDVCLRSTSHTAQPHSTHAL